ncbi:Chromosome segregation ATPase-like protein, partial [human gut metagenome]
EELELLISEEERKVFEEILMNTISQKVKAKIFMSNNWVKKINELMSSMNTSSSLKLSLSWVPKKSLLCLNHFILKSSSSCSKRVV